ncbi:MAG: cobalamin-dependent protein, partial [Clostridia bacterium]|nr:cobalamin-dependent protein [Clostridia bacterium]
IGKNIVKAVVSNYGYRCIDLGRDVSKEEVLDAIAKYKPEVVGLSALMTTTLGSMTETIKAIKEYDKSIVIIVGGAVVTADYALTNGVIYARDAQSTAKKLEQIFNNR